MKKICVAMICLITVVATLVLGVVLCPAHKDNGSGMAKGVNVPITNQMNREALMTVFPAETELPVNTIIDDIRKTGKVFNN